MEVTVKITTIINLLTGLFGSYLIEVIKHYSGLNGNRAMALTLFVSLAFGAAAAYLAGEFTANAYNSVVQVLASATIVYQFLIKKN